jgi:alpha-mannosidase
LLRAPRYPDPETDQGRHSARYTLVSGAGIGAAVEAGLRLNLPVREVRGTTAPAPLVTVDGDGVVIETVKLAEDRSGDVIVRLYESLGARTTGRLRWDFVAEGAEIVDLLERPLESCAVDESAVRFALRPFQLLTVRIRTQEVTTDEDD